MSDILLISGSPSERSRSQALLEHAASFFAEQGIPHTKVSVRDFPPEDLILARYNSPALTRFVDQVQQARSILIATPVYKAAYTGALKALLDILPQHAFRGKTLLPLATGGSSAHLLVIDYSIKPVLSVLGASDILQGVYAVDSQVDVLKDGGKQLDAEIRERLESQLKDLVAKKHTLLPA